MKQKKPTHPARRFQRQVLAFCLLAVVLFGLSLLVTASRTTVTLRPIVTQETVKKAFHIGPDDLTGRILKKTIDTTVTTKDLPPGTTEEGYATGVVTITNNWSQSQPLQAGTRLVSKDGVLFRTADRVDVPIGGSVDVTVTADQPGKNGDIAPTTFEIVALWEGLKSQIVGKSEEAFTGGVAKVSRLTQEVLDATLHEARNKIDAEARAAFLAELNTTPTTNANLIGIDISFTEQIASAKIGDPITELTVTISADAYGIAASQEAINTALLATAEKNRAIGTTILDLVETSRTVETQKADAETQTADFVVHDLAEVIVATDHPMFETKNIVGKTREEIHSYFAQFPVVEIGDVDFSPFWSNSASRIPGNITITLLKPKA